MLEWLEHVITDYLGAYGYPAVFVLMVLESACIPIPSEVTMVFGGFLVSRGDLDFVWVALIGTIANVIGSWLPDLGGGGGGGAPFNPERRGELAVFVSRLLPVIRTFISLPAGVARMNFWKFTLYTFLGCLPWTFALTWAGMLLGANWESFLRYGDPISWAIAAITVAVVAWWLIRRIRARRAGEPSEPVSPAGTGRSTG